MAANARQSVWIIGKGVVSAAGAGAAATLDQFQTTQRRSTTQLPFASEIDCVTFQVDAPLPAVPGLAGRSRTVRLAMHAVNQAVAEAGEEALRAGPGRVGVCMATTVASQLNNLPFYREYRDTGAAPLEPVAEYFAADLAEAVADQLGALGPRLTVVNACTSGADAIGVAASWLRANRCDVAIAGGADELSQIPLAGFWSLGVMSATPCKPFDAHRTGLNLGEGAGVLCLAREDWAERKGLPRQYELAGFGTACDAHHLTRPHPEGQGLAAAIDKALVQAQCPAADIGFVNAHGTATQENDRVEGNVIHRRFAGVPFASTKGYTGHTLGAAGGMEAVFTVLGLDTQWMPGNVGFEQPDPACGAAPVATPTKLNASYGLSLSLAFGGNNAAVLIRRAG